MVAAWLWYCFPVEAMWQGHAATIYKWAQEDAAKEKPKKGIPDYSFKEGESL